MPGDPQVDAVQKRAGFHRDQLTFAFYGNFVIWGWLLYSFNPSVTLLADDFDISLAQAGLHGTAMAGGGIVAAFLSPRLVRRYGRRAALFVAYAAITIGIVALVTAADLPSSLTAVVVLAIGGNIAISAAQPGLALHHGPAASAAVTEANGVGSSIGLIGPLAVGACVAIGWGWRPAVAVTVLIAAVTAVMLARMPVGGAMTPPARRAHGGDTLRADGEQPLLGSVEALAVAVVDPTDPHDSAADRRALNRLPAWCFLASLVAAIALEMTTTYWSTDLVREQTGAGAGIAAATTAGLVAGMSVIRFVMGPISLRVPPALILVSGFLVSIGGWAILWTATTPAVAIVGLVVTGLGFGVQYPLSISLLIATAPAAGDAAQSRATLAGGIAVGVAPFALGALADAVGIHAAFAVVPAAAVLGCAAAALGARASSRASKTSSREA
ncbi:MFS transporter [Cellulomonas rhizosphaerae]|uniref:MFS transporter n=1 Tax=Cellulomonas rhizosphaerae TaxID=2293719 RepID=A0A413RLQ5_9CELL|nr:MFS transporter [Cellulomonas rhizosphaerae]RHA40998.1 MFS transporter [Cellulomonas rhizosphaerae]